MRFDWPLALVGARASSARSSRVYVDRDRRRGAYAAASRTRPDPQRRRPQPRSAAATAAAILLVALVLLVVGVARPHATVSVPREEATIVLAHRRLALDEGERRRADAARRGARGRARLPRPGPGQVPGRRRLVRDPRGRGRRADGRPLARRVGARHAEARRGHRASAMPSRCRSWSGGRRARTCRRRRARSSSSPTARRTAAGSSPTKPSPRRRSSGARVHGARRDARRASSRRR